MPNSTLPGDGAFMGPVRRVPVGGIEIGYRQFAVGPDLQEMDRFVGLVTGFLAPDRRSC